jgi:hypothetical protein
MLRRTLYLYLYSTITLAGNCGSGRILAGNAYPCLAIRVVSSTVHLRSIIPVHFT